MKKFLTILLNFCFLSVFATHERAGEITYKHISGYTYEISIITYTKLSSRDADRCSLIISFGDDTSHYEICRSNYEVGDPASDPAGAQCRANPVCSTHHMGEWSLGTPSLQSLDIKKNIYTVRHTYPGPYTYTITMTDPNRNDDIINVPNNTPLSLFVVLTIPSFSPGLPNFNNSPILTNPPIDRACIGDIFIHNPGAVDPDGDSLSYQLGVCYQEPGVPVQNYFIPPGVTLDPVTGDFKWDVPQLLPTKNLPYEYNFAIDIIEWKLNVVNHKRYRSGIVRRDFQVRVYNCQNNPPEISAVIDTCIVANTAFTFTVTATDVIQKDGIQSFIATGGPFNTTPTASFVSNAPHQVSATGVFSWKPICNQVRLQPYQVTFRATDFGSPDNPPMPLSDYKTLNIKVIPPAPKLLSLTPLCASIKLLWDTAYCNPATNRLFQYKIYRRTGCDSLVAQHCETGMPSSWDYSLAGTVSNSTTTFTDVGLTNGYRYTYRVVAVYIDGSTSYASSPLCAKLNRDGAVLTNVDVVTTGSTSGIIHIKWAKPIADKDNFDTTRIGHQGPYRFDLYTEVGLTNPTKLLASYISPYFATLNTTSYIDTTLNTANHPYSYRVEFYSASNISCPSQNASSVFLSCTPNNHRITLTWKEIVPWKNNQYIVYKENKNTSTWDSIATTAIQTFTDSSLINNKSYCYKIKSIGSYPDTTLPAPFINWSQELCCVPIDLTPPCPLTLSVDTSCEDGRMVLHWNNPNNLCSKDAKYYVIRYASVEGKDYVVLDTVPNIQITDYIRDSVLSIAGCYVVTAIDSSGNESLYSNKVCVDNCPFYELPNVFTPNGDGSNDFFIPLHPYRYVQDVDMKIYNRWGSLVFETTDREINWDGKDRETKRLCADGVYYYICTVNEIRLIGITPRILKGNVHLLHGK